MRLLITTAGSHGDINPFIAIGRAMVSRGHEAVMLVNPYYKTQVEEAGVGFLPIGEHFDLKEIATTLPDIMHPRRAGKLVLNELMIPHAREMFDLLPRLLREFKPHAVLHHHISMAVPPICLRHGVPFATAVLAPMMWLSREDVFTPGQWSPVNPPPWQRWLLHNLAPPLMRLMVDPALNRVRVAAGYSRQKCILKTVAQGGTVNLGLWSPALRGPLDSDPATGVICGFPWHDRHGEHEHAPADVQQFLSECESAGQPPIIFSLGTAAVHVAGDFYHIATEACRVLGRRGMLLVGPTRTAPANLPDGVRAFSYAPFSEVLPRACATVHHGGIGSSAQALRAGKPTVVVPHAHDQFDNAARLKRLGVSETVPRGKLTVARLVQALRTVLESPDPARHAGALGKVVSREDGAVTAAAAIENLVR